MWRTARLAITGIAVAACARATALSAPADDSEPLYAPEIVAAHVIDTYDAVERLRPEFLRPMLEPTEQTEPVRVYLGNTELGGPEALRRIPLERVTQIRYLSPAAARVRWGVLHVNGVIFVSTSADGE
jgi:hypothetical protein